MGKDISMDDLFTDQPTESQRAMSGPVTCLGMTFKNDDARRADLEQELAALPVDEHHANYGG